MYGEWNIRAGDQVFIEAKDDFYKQFLRGWFSVDTVLIGKDRFTITDSVSGDTFKMFRNKQGICCVVEHEFNRYGECMWDEHKQQYRFIFVPVQMYVKTFK